MRDPQGRGQEIFRNFLPPASFVLPFIQSSALLDNITPNKEASQMKFVLWQQQLVREEGSDVWTLRFDREIVIEGPSKEWCEAMFIGTVEINSVCKVLSINVMPYENWRQAIDKWADSDLLAAGDAVNQMEEKGFVNYPANTPTYWCDLSKQRVAAV